ncbi:type II toxin-antitoxin system prevent-host-death family antitoxin [Agromyces sp. CFH 90414]|uniref:Antitoxin n=1 Tax=Agromyces agglutinans TaxID=2662258 RepID=A0A6I2F2Z4_9MICO|nr:type II toxin-antitoxin system prevent-host-death family antitoxin [Agromyces agglutinans]MRG59905.1 type II toxin-antitoxin system prevent-host-death family antitoxin [Agromyces agglutinans]
MQTVSVRELRNHGGEILDRVIRGEHLVVTRDGTEVAELVPVPAPRQQVSVLIDRRRLLPRVDPAGLRADIDALIDQAL